MTNTITEVHGLNVREKENLIAPSIYLLCTNSSSKHILKELMKIEGSDTQQEKLKFINIKSGLDAKNLKKLKQNNDSNEFYKELFEHAPSLIACTYDEVDNLDDRVKVMEGIGNKLNEFEREILDNGIVETLSKKKKVPGLDESVITEIERSIDKANNLFEILPEYIKPEWEQLCKKILSWGCSFDKVSI